MLILPENMRESVRKPFGKLVTGENFKTELAKAGKPLISVGDQCAYDLITSGSPPDMLIVDFKIKRVEIGQDMKKAIASHAKSPFLVFSGAGAITDELSRAVEKMLVEGKGAIIVVGEDDLSSLLVMAHAKEGTLVYGQPNEGAVFVPLGGKEVMKRAQGVLEGMEQA